MSLILLALTSARAAPARHIPGSCPMEALDVRVVGNELVVAGRVRRTDAMEIAECHIHIAEMRFVQRYATPFPVVEWVESVSIAPDGRLLAFAKKLSAAGDVPGETRFRLMESSADGTVREDCPRASAGPAESDTCVLAAEVLYDHTGEILAIDGPVFESRTGEGISALVHIFRRTESHWQPHDLAIGVGSLTSVGWTGAGVPYLLTYPAAESPDGRVSVQALGSPTSQELTWTGLSTRELSVEPGPLIVGTAGEAFVVGEVRGGAAAIDRVSVADPEAGPARVERLSLDIASRPGTLRLLTPVRSAGEVGTLGVIDALREAVFLVDEAGHATSWRIRGVRSGSWLYMSASGPCVVENVGARRPRVRIRCSD